MSGDESLELKLARQAYAEAEQLKKAAEKDRAAADAKLAEAKDLMSRYDNDKHGAAIALQQINEREQAERSAAA